MKGLIIVLVLMFPALALADTTWVAGGGVEGVWTAEHSPYMIAGHITLGEGNTLEIGPGVECNFQGSFTFYVGGTLRAAGTPADSVLFTRRPADSTHGWRGMECIPTSNVSLEYCVIEQMRSQPETGMCINVATNSFMVRRSTIRNNYFSAIHIADGNSATLEHCDLVYNGPRAGGSTGNALHVWINASATLRHCFIGYNHSLDGGAIEVENGSILNLDLCIFRNNRASIWGGAIFSDNGEITATQCTFIGNQALQGSHINPAGTTGSLIVNSCIFANSHGVGGAFERGVPGMAVHHSLFFRNTPIFRGGGAPTNFGAINRLNGNGDSTDVYWNLFVDPMFADSSGDSLDILFGSPCIDAGDSALIWDPDLSPPDIGAVAFEQGWNTIQFVGGFSMIGCPCEYPMGLNEGSVVRLRHDAAHDGITPDDPVISGFVVSAGAGLPPWNGYWEPRPEGQIAVDNFYVEVMAGVCCWSTGVFPISEGIDTVVIDPMIWQCIPGENGQSCGGGGTSTVARPPGGSPESIAPRDGILLVAPNPFNAQTTIQFALLSKDNVRIALFDLQGRRIADIARGVFDKGTHRVDFDGTKLPSGVYFVRSEIGRDLSTKKLLLLK